MNTYRLMDLMEGARNLVVEYACVKKGQNVCIYADTGCDHLVVEAIAIAAKEAGGEVVITISSEVNDPEESGLIDPPKIVRNAFYASDVILSIVFTKINIFCILNFTYFTSEACKPLYLCLTYKQLLLI